MGDTGSERSKPPSLPPRCPLETTLLSVLGLTPLFHICLILDVQKKQLDEDCAPGPSPSSGSSQSSAFSSDISSSSSSHSLPSDPIKLEQMTAEDKATILIFPKQACSSSICAVGTCGPKCSVFSDTGPEEEATAAKRARPSEEGASHGGQKQRSRRRCHCCQSKLELVQQELGLCRCGNVFCMLHRLPEQHDCRFDHLGRGRQEAVLKMVKLDRKVGRSCQRIGEECS
uniref:Zinc finger AN1-type containing 3 n=1 Tax=Paramormyrops kingsleyae TaxID=1676925 RepID=A0A3B3TGY6_9TELE